MNEGNLFMIQFRIINLNLAIKIKAPDNSQHCICRCIDWIDKYKYSVSTNIYIQLSRQQCCLILPDNSQHCICPPRRVSADRSCPSPCLHAPFFFITNINYMQLTIFRLLTVLSIMPSIEFIKQIWLTVWIHFVSCHVHVLLGFWVPGKSFEYLAKAAYFLLPLLILCFLNWEQTKNHINV